jgi:hypothetical protein
MFYTTKHYSTCCVFALQLILNKLSMSTRFRFLTYGPSPHNIDRPV